MGPKINKRKPKGDEIVNCITEEPVTSEASEKHSDSDRDIVNAPGLTGYVKTQRKMPDWTPQHDGTVGGFPHWEAKLEAWVSEYLDRTVYLDTEELEEEVDRLIYNTIIKGINGKLYEHVSSQTKGKGMDSLILLRKLHLGTTQKRKVSCILNLGNLRYPSNAQTFTTQLHKIKSDCETFEIFNKGAELIVVLAMAALPSEFNSLIQQLKSQQTMPTLAQFTERLIDEELSIKNEAKTKIENIAVVTSNKKRKRPQQKKRKTTSDGYMSYAEVPAVVAAEAAVGTGGGPTPAYQRGGGRSSPREGMPRAGAHLRGGGGGGRPNQQKCLKCLGRNHLRHECRSTKWCRNCRNASHNTEHCKFPRQ